MRAKRIEVATSVAGRLFAAENGIDGTIINVSELNAAMAAARLDANLSAIIGQPAFTTCTDALIHLAKAREQIVATHAHLKTASDEIGLRAVSFGDSVKPEKGEAAGVVPPLRIAS